MSKFVKITLKEDTNFLDLGFIFLKPAIIMLALGGLGHQLNIPYLFKFGYWETFLLVIATGLFRGNPVRKFKVEEK